MVPLRTWITSWAILRKTGAKYLWLKKSKRKVGDREVLVVGSGGIEKDIYFIPLPTF
jgi:hypothetical protein